MTLPAILYLQNGIATRRSSIISFGNPNICGANIGRGVEGAAPYGCRILCHCEEGEARRGNPHRYSGNLEGIARR